MSRLSPAALGVLWLTGCGSEVPPLPDDPFPVEEVGCIRVEPLRVEFPTVDLREDPTGSRTLAVTIRNGCGGALEIRQLELRGQSPESFSHGPLSALLLEQDETANVDVTFSPAGPGTFEARLLISSNDAENPEEVLRLVGDALGPQVELDPPTIGFGAPLIGCRQTQKVEIRNRGNVDLTVTGASLSTASGSEVHLDLADLAAGPQVLRPYADNVSGPWAEVFVEYRPLDIAGDEAVLEVASDDPARPLVRLEAAGTGTPYITTTDRFEQTSSAQTDIVITLDRSGPLDANAEAEARFARFVETLDLLEADYRIVAVVADDGCVVGDEPYIDPSFSGSEAAETFAAMADDDFALAPYGTNGTAHFMLAEAALAYSNLAPGGCNEGLLRPDAQLSLIHVADEPDQSVNPWSYYVALSQSLKPAPEQVRVSAIAGPVPYGCTGASPGRGYDEASLATGGVFRSICDTDWNAHFEALAIASAPGRRHFELTQLPVAPTLVVHVDGAPASEGWTYDATHNVVVFEPEHRPPAGAPVEVTYELQPDCED